MFSNKDEPMQTTPERTSFMASPLKAISSPFIEAVKSAAFKATQEFDRFYDNFQATFSPRTTGSRISKQTPETTERIRSKLNRQKKLNSNRTSLTPYFERHTLDARAKYRFKTRNPFHLDGFEADDEDTPSLSELNDEDTPTSPLHSESSYQQDTPDELTFVQQEKDESFTDNQIEESQEEFQEIAIRESQTETFHEHKQMHEFGREIFATQRQTEEDLIEQLEVGRRRESFDEEQQMEESKTVSPLYNRITNGSFHEVEKSRRESFYRHQEKENNMSRRLNGLVRSCSALRRQASLLADEISATDLNDVDMEEFTIPPPEVKSPVRMPSSFRKKSVMKADSLVTPPQSIEYPKHVSARSPIRITAQYQTPQRYSPIRTATKSTPLRRSSPHMRSAFIPSSPVRSSTVVTPMRSTHIPSSPIHNSLEVPPIHSTVMRTSPIHNSPEVSHIHSPYQYSSDEEQSMCLSPEVSPRRSTNIPSSPIESPVQSTVIPYNSPKVSLVHSTNRYSSPEESSMRISPRCSSPVQNRKSSPIHNSSMSPPNPEWSVLLSPNPMEILLREENSGPRRRTPKTPGSRHDPDLFWDHILSLNARQVAEGRIIKNTPISQRISTLQANMKKSWGNDGAFSINDNGIPVSSKTLTNKLEQAAYQPERTAIQVKKRDIFDDDDNEEACK